MTTAFIEGGVECVSLRERLHVSGHGVVTGIESRETADQDLAQRAWLSTSEQTPR